MTTIGPQTPANPSTQPASPVAAGQAKNPEPNQDQVEASSNLQASRLAAIHTIDFQGIFGGLLAKVNEQLVAQFFNRAPDPNLYYKQSKDFIESKLLGLEEQFNNIATNDELPSELRDTAKALGRYFALTYARQSAIPGLVSYHVAKGDETFEAHDLKPKMQVYFNDFRVGDRNYYFLDLLATLDQYRNHPALSKNGTQIIDLLDYTAGSIEAKAKHFASTAAASFFQAWQALETNTQAT